MMECYLVNNHANMVHKCYVDNNDRVYTNEACNVDDMESHTVIQNMLEPAHIMWAARLVEANTHVWCANCFPWHNEHGLALPE